MGKTMEVAALVVVVVKEGGERGKNRDAPDWHEGLRLLAALRQLGGVRRGIEIANAHYGYFPIEGRIPLSLSLSTPPPSLTTLLALSHSVLSAATPHRPRARPLSFSPSRSREAAPFHLFALSLLTRISSAPVSVSLSIPSYPPPSHRISLYLTTSLLTLISPRDFLFPPTRSLPLLRLSFSFLLGTPRDLARTSRSPRAFVLRKRTLESVRTQSLSAPSVPFLPISDILTSYVDCFARWFYRFSPAERSASLSFPISLTLFFALCVFYFCLFTCSFSFILPLSLSPSPFFSFFPSVPMLLHPFECTECILVTRIAPRVISHSRARFTHCEAWLFHHLLRYLHRLHAISPPSFTLVALPLAPACLL